ncbi:MAG: hypothetical protein WCC95_18140 [Candidatus Sulfotelmatobacter sp.]
MREVPKGFHVHSNGGGLVEDTAYVEASVFVGEDALVSGDAQVFGDARVFGNAWEQSPLYIQGTRHPITNSKYGELTIGCHAHPFKYWLKHYKAIGKANGYTKEQIKEYGVLIAAAAKVGR